MRTRVVTSSMADGLRGGLYLVVNDSDRIKVVTGMSGLTNLRSRVLLKPLSLSQIHSSFLIFIGHGQTEFANFGIVLRLVLDDHQRIGAGLASAAFQRC